MKNLLNLGIDILEILPPVSLDLKISKKERYERRFRSKFSKWHRIDNRPLSKIIDDVIRDHIGKSFDDAYSVFCKKVKWYQKHLFKLEFNPQYYSYNYYYHIDENGLIQVSKPQNKYKGPYTYQSLDAKWEKRHKVTGACKPNFVAYFRNERNVNSRYTHHVPIYRLKGKYGYYEAKDNDFEAILVQGVVKYFDSKQNPEYKRLMAEKIKQSRILYAKKQLLESQKAYSFISQSEIKLKKSKEQDIIKILAHGMDPETSFRNEKQTNPDLIKEKQ